MTNGNRRFNSSGVSAAAVLLSVAVAIVVSLALNNWWLFVPVILLELGVFVLMLGLSVGRPSQGTPWTRSDSNYFLFWGNLMAVLGAILIIDAFFPGYFIILIVVLLVWFAVFALLFSMRKRSA
jgi:hypothetical protein